MGFYCLRAGDNVRSGECKEFICDTAADIAELPKLEKCAPGSTAFVIATGGRYMLNTAGGWKKLPADAGGSEHDTLGTALPAVSAADNGKFLRVVSGAWAAQALTNVAEVGA